MDKESFDQIDIDLPKQEILTAVHQGIALGREKKHKQKRKRNFKKTTVTLVAAASLFLASGFIFSPVSNVLAKVPLIGTVFQEFGIGGELSKKGLVTSLNQKASSNGVDVTITSAYYDGNIIGLSFKAKGKGLSEEDIDKENGRVMGYDSYLFDGSEEKQWEGSYRRLKKSNDYFVAAMEFTYNKEVLPSDFSLPLVFNSIAGVDGKWEFKVPVKQLPVEVIPTDVSTSTNNHAYSLTVDAVRKGEATTMIDFTSRLVSKDDSIEIRVEDNLGKEFSFEGGNAFLTTNPRNGYIEQTGRRPFHETLNPKASYLMIYSEVERDQQETFTSLQGAVPLNVKSKRFDYGLTISKVEIHENQLLVEYSLKNVKTNHNKKDILKEFADSISLVKSADIERDSEGRYTEYGIPIYRDKVVLINEEAKTYQSRFIIEDNFSISDYSLMIPFGVFSTKEDSIKLPPLKIRLPK